MIVKNRFSCVLKTFDPVKLFFLGSELETETVGDILCVLGGRGLKRNLVVLKKHLEMCTKDTFRGVEKGHFLKLLLHKQDNLSVISQKRCNKTKHPPCSGHL